MGKLKIKLVTETNLFEIHSDDNEYIGEISLEGKETLPHYAMGQKYKLHTVEDFYLDELEQIVKFIKKKQKDFDNTMRGK